MAKTVLCGCVSTLLAAVAGCVSPAPQESAVAEARKLITSGQAECVAVKDGRIAAVERGRGVSPLLNLYTARPETLRDATVVDKVIGRAAGFIIISGGAKAAHGELISEDAIALLKRHGIAVSGTKIVPRILNGKMDGLCPLEQSVLGLDDPAAAMTALRRRVAELQRGR
ncbi:MAG: DUF1893 domain-containing protein [Lentisphaeria bacterium]|nr:DUF1893 domain-containing protein [Lentisphaeria bacterium]